MMKSVTAMVCTVASFGAKAEEDINPFWEADNIKTGPLNKPVDHTGDEHGDRCWAIQDKQITNSLADGQKPQYCSF